VINDILDFSKIEAASWISSAQLRSQEVVETTVDLVAERAQAKGWNSPSSLPTTSPRLLSGDPADPADFAEPSDQRREFTERGRSISRSPATLRPAGCGLTLQNPRHRNRACSGSPGEAFQPFSQLIPPTTRRMAELARLGHLHAPGRENARHNRAESTSESAPPCCFTARWNKQSALLRPSAERLPRDLGQQTRAHRGRQRDHRQVLHHQCSAGRCAMAEK
jgi:hypothetical protein